MLKSLPLFLAPLLAFSSGAMAAPDKYSFDKDHTHIIFLVGHVGFSKMIGRVKEFDGYFTFDDKDPKSSELDVTLKSESVDTDVPALNKVLQGEKFFNTARFPDMHFKSTGIVPTGPRTGDVVGNFTLLGVTKPLVLHVTYNKSGIHPLTNDYTSGFSADATLSRSAFGMSAYAPDVVGDEVVIHIEAEGTDALRHPGNVKTPH